MTGPVRHLSLRSRIAAILYGATALGSVVTGAIYLFRNSFMPYHSVALGKTWNEVDDASQFLIKGLMEVAGAGLIALGLLVFALVLVPIRRGERWARLAVPIALLVVYVPTLAATLNVLHNTPASPPWRTNLVACVAAGLGLLLDAPWMKDRLPSKDTAARS